MQVTLPIRLPVQLKNVFLTTSAALLLFAASSSAQVVRQINSSGTTQPVPTQVGGPGTQDPGIQDQERDTALDGNDSDDDLGVDIQGNISGKTALNRSIAPGPGQGPQCQGMEKPSQTLRSLPALMASTSSTSALPTMATSFQLSLRTRRSAPATALCWNR